MVSVVGIDDGVHMHDTIIDGFSQKKYTRSRLCCVQTV